MNTDKLIVRMDDPLINVFLVVIRVEIVDYNKNIL